MILEGWRLPSLCVFRYPSYMVELTRYQLRRIRTATAADIDWMAGQDRYWTRPALREILKRIEKLNNENVFEGLVASQSILAIPKRARRYGREIPVDLQGLILAVHASALRFNGQLFQALAIHEQALVLKDLSKAGRGDILTRMAVTLVCLGRLDQGLATIETALKLVRDSIPALVIRGWIFMVQGNLSAALHDSLCVLENAQDSPPRSDFSLLSAIVNICTILSYETVLDIDGSIYPRIESAIESCRLEIFPTTGGSNFYKVQRPRLMLSRAEALMMARTGRLQEAVAPLQRIIPGLSENYPDDALAATLDLVCVLTQLGRNREVTRNLEAAVLLLERIRFDVHPIPENALRIAAKRGSLTYGQAIELRSMLRPTKDNSGPRPTEQHTMNAISTAGESGSIGPTG